MYLNIEEFEGFTAALAEHRPNITYLLAISPDDPYFERYGKMTGYSVARTLLGDDADIGRVYALRDEMLRDWETAARNPEYYGIRD